MLRVLVAVVLASALLAAGLPGIELAARERSEATLTAEADRLRTAIADLRHRESAVGAAVGARRVVTVEIPARARTAAGGATLALGGVPWESRSDGRSAVDLAWRIDGGPITTRRLPGLRVVHYRDGRIRDEPLVLEAPGEHRLALTRIERGGRRLLAVRRLPEL
ncbi:DUF7311 family protein [Halorientalis pallida]|uniref:DUF7311 domain-containing protein n=1 Tax=Halorientalis pallida TaxID=2479928 RepID=A0A498KUC9_9EURY|nr:hypothetical protein [Halorientalis pallida]RXK48480.1 hypothetical protein EAF64_12425 [Halorientalis pallida]